MKEVCIYCGAELLEGKDFCAKCGKSLRENERQQVEAQRMVAAEDQLTSSSSGAPQKTVALQSSGEKGFLLEKVRSVTERYILRIISMIACVIVFLSGFFINIGFMPMEQVQSKLSYSAVPGIANLEDVFASFSYEQNVFNVFGALTVPVGGEEEEYESEKFYNALIAKVTDIVNKYQSEIIRLMMEAQDNGEMAERLTFLLEQMINEVSKTVGDINLIKLDRIEAELTFTQAMNEATQLGEENISEKTLKQANDSLIRTSIMVGFPIGVIYLQIVSLICMITTAVGIFTSRTKFTGGKFFLLYLIGLAFLFLIAQFTATTLAGTGMFCFIFASAMLLLYLAGRVFIIRGMTAQKIVSVAVSGVVAVLSFTAMCVLFNASFEFGGLVDKIGSVFGFGVFDGTVFADGEGIGITKADFITYGCIYFVTLAFTVLSFFFSVARLNKLGGSVVPQIILTAIASAGLFIAYFVLYSLVDTATTERLIYAPSAFITASVLLAAALIAWIVGVPLGRKFDKQRISA